MHALVHLQSRRHAPGTAVALHPAPSGLYASYDPEQICEADAVRAIGLVAQGCPDRLEVRVTVGISVEGIAKHGGRG
jgi:hypothetical protein